MTKSISSGFTLIELLIVIAVVSILSVILIFTINPQSIITKGQDAKRLTDMESIVKAITLALTSSEVVLAENDASCATCSSNTGTQSIDGTGYVKFTVPTGKPGLSGYLPALPTDPINNGVYIYKFGSTLSNFEVNAVLAHPDNAPKMSTDGGNDPKVYEIGTSLTIL